MARIVALAAIATMVFAIASTEVRAANPDFCRDYANAAVNQTRAAWNNWRCRPGANGGRWNLNWDAHYGWCLSTWWQNAQNERQIRHNYLAQCNY